MTPAQSIQFVNGFTAVTDADVAAYVLAQGRQFAEHVAPMWGICPAVIFTPGAKVPADGSSPAWLSDTLDVDGALGYHDEDAQGAPFIKVADIAGYDWRTTASHECLEVKGDSPANIWAQIAPNTFVAYELGDPVQGDSYDVDGIPMSNFVFPAWFDPLASPGSRFDYLGKLTKPGTMSPGGYMIVWTVSGQPTQQFGANIHEVTANVHIHFGPGVSQERRLGIVAKNRHTRRRVPR